MKKLLIFLSILTILFSCKKEQKPDFNKEYPPRIYDTIKPLPYFPAYPNSNWTYLITYSQTIKYSNPLAYNIYDTIITYSTSSTYLKDVCNITYPPSQIFHSDTCLVPFYDKVPIWAYKKHQKVFNMDCFSLFVSDSLTVGTTWYEINEWFGYSSLTIRTKDTSVILNGQVYAPVIIVRSGIGEYGGGDGPYGGSTDLYYAKNIGLIKTKTISTTNEGKYGLMEQRLIDYHINK